MGSPVDSSVTYQPIMPKTTETEYRKGLSVGELGALMGAMNNSFQSFGDSGKMSEIATMRRENALARQNADSIIFGGGSAGQFNGPSSLGFIEPNSSFNVSPDSGGFNLGNNSNSNSPFAIANNSNNNPFSFGNNTATNNASGMPHDNMGFSMSMSFNFSDYGQSGQNNQVTNANVQAEKPSASAASPAKNTISPIANTGAPSRTGLGYALEKMSKNENPDSAMNPVQARTAEGSRPTFEQSLADLYASYGKKLETPAKEGTKEPASTAKMTEIDSAQLKKIEANENKLRSMGINVPINNGIDDEAQNQRLKNVDEGLKQLMSKRLLDREQEGRLADQNQALTWLEKTPYTQELPKGWTAITPTNKIA